MAGRLGDVGDARVEGAGLTGQLLENLVGESMSDAAHILGAADETPARQQPPAGDIEEPCLDDQLVSLQTVGALDQHIGTEQAPLVEIDLGAEQADPAGIVKERRRSDEAEHSGQIEVGAQHLLQFVGHGRNSRTFLR